MMSASSFLVTTVSGRALGRCSARQAATGRSGNGSVKFFRLERDWILKDASPKVGQKIFGATIGRSDAYVPALASESYYFEASEIAATDTVERHLIALEQLVRDAETQFGKRDDSYRPD